MAPFPDDSRRILESIVRILVIGAAGMVGRKLVERLVRTPEILGSRIAAANLVDIVAPEPPEASFSCATAAYDIAAPYVATRLAAERPDIVFLLAAIVSGEAETDFDKGYAINLDGARQIMDALRLEHLRSSGAYTPRLVFTSSIAVFGAPFPEIIDDEFLSADQLRNPEGDRRTAAVGLFAPRLPQRDRHPPADHLRSPRPPQSRRVRLLLEYHP
jgi:nucleoside-diphosphate-sugar epimerase